MSALQPKGCFHDAPSSSRQLRLKFTAPYIKCVEFHEHVAPLLWFAVNDALVLPSTASEINDYLLE